MEDTVDILLVEDSRTDARLIELLLAQADARFGRFHVRHASTLSAALEQVERNHVMIVLLDLSLPDSQGLETFQRMRAKAPSLSVVILTGYEDIELAIEAIRLGADDYLSKGEVDGNALARTIRFSLERRHWRVVNEEIQLASRLQQFFLPKAAPELCGFDIGGACRPSERVGGDYFDYLLLPDGSLGIVVADVAGHGIASALIMAGTRRMLRTLVETHADIGETLTVANRALRDDMDGGRFVTIFFGRLDVPSRSLTYASGAHPAYVIAARGGTRRLMPTALPLGIFHDTVVPCEGPIALQPGDMVLVVSDGCEDARSAEDEPFGLCRVLDAVVAHRCEPAGRIVDALFQEVLAFCEPAAPRDDMTAVVIKVGEAN